MPSDKIVVELQPREQLRKRLRPLRVTGQIPGVIHNHGKDSIHVQGNDGVITKTYAAAGKHHPIQLTVADKHHLVLIKDVDFEPTKQRIRHVVFQAIKQNEATEAEVPVMFTEDVEIPAERKSLLVLKQLDHVQIKALPSDLPSVIYINPASLQEVGDSLSVADLVVPKGVAVLTEPDVQVAIVEMPKDQIAEADAAAAALAEDADKPEAEVESTEQSSDTPATDKPEEE